ncbi:ParB/RepB/Spo0J family partition protein [Candidatus Magnetomoraceae bacterium gMMP-15]
MIFKYSSVSVDKIDLNDLTFCITTETDNQKLYDSIQSIGLINSPIIQKKISLYRIICGFRRIKTCVNIATSEIDVKIIESNISDKECAVLAITDNTMQRTLNLLEQSKAYALLSKYFPDNANLLQAASNSGLPDNINIIKKIKSLCKLPQPIQNGILNEIISLQIALKLSKLKTDQSIKFAELFKNLGMSLSKQREIITLVQEIACRENTSILDILDSKEIQDILNQKNKDKNRKTSKIRYYLKRRRFPNLIKSEETFTNHVKNLHLNSDFQLIPPPYFEGNTYTLKLNFKNMEDLKKHQSTLKNLIQKWMYFQ